MQKTNSEEGRKQQGFALKMLFHGWLMKNPRFLFADTSDARQRVPTTLELGRDDLLVVRVLLKDVTSHQ
jgi:hypothetical protein